MYEPKYPPKINQTPMLLPSLRFGVVRKSEHVDPSANETDPLHIHSCLEIFLNVSSNISFLVNNNLYRVPVGDAVLSRPGDIHMGVFHTVDIHEYVCIWIDTDFDSPLFSFLKASDFCPLCSFDEPTKKRLQALVLALQTACDTGGTELERVCALLQILRILEQKKPEGSTRGLIPAPLQEILDDVQANFAQIHTVNELMNTHFVSSSTLTRWFRSYLHTSPREYLESVRLSNAALLLERGASVTEACMRSGFSDCSHFIVLFKRKFGKTPLQYKKGSPAVETSASPSPSA